MTSIRTISHAGIDSVRTRLAAFVEQSPRSGPMVVAAVVGAVAGLGAVVFLEMIELVEWLIIDQLFEGYLADFPWWFILFAPALGGLIVGPIVKFFAPEAKGHGVPEVMNAVETRGGRIRPRVAGAKALASAFTLGSGGSGGTEGPIVQIGSAFGSTVGQFLRLSDETTKLLVASGAAGGIAAVFNAPIAGVFFAMEVILRRFSTRNFSVVVLASVVATITAVAFHGDEPVLTIPQYGLLAPGELLLYLLLGALCGGAAVGFTRILYFGEDVGERQRPIPPVLLPAVGGLIVGILGLWHAGALGTGDEATDAALVGDLVADEMMLLFFLKIGTTVFTLASGGSGGVFRPSLMMGAMLGGTFGIAANELFDGIAPSGAYATVGMAAMFAGAARAPITSMLIIFEMTRDYEIMLPLMVAVVAATVIAGVIDPLSIYTRRLFIQGIHLDEESAGTNVMQSIRVADAMGPVTITLPPDMPLDEVARVFAGDRSAVGLVVDGEGMVRGVVTNTDVNEAIVAHRDGIVAMDLATTSIRTVYPEQSLHDALAVFAGSPFNALPVVDREQNRVPRGILRRADVTNAYVDAIERRQIYRRRRSLGTAVNEDVRYIEHQVRAHSVANGLTLKELPLTEDAVIVAVRHEGQTVIPRGHTLLEEGDRVTVIATAAAVESVRNLFDSP